MPEIEPVDYNCCIHCEHGPEEPANEHQTSCQHGCNDEPDDDDA